MGAVLSIAIYAAAVVILGDAVVRLNHIERHGHHGERFCAVSAAVGSFGILAGPVCSGNRLLVSLLLVLVGGAGVILIDRRDAIVGWVKRWV